MQPMSILVAVVSSVAIASAMDFQVGGYRSDLSGLYLDFRWPVGNWHVGAGASEGFLEVATFDEKLVPEGTGNTTSMVRTRTPTTAQAALHALELFAGRDLLRDPAFVVSASTGLGWALLDGTENGQDGRSRDMLTIPVRIDGIWKPGIWKRLPGLGLATSVGVEMRSGIDKPDLFQEMSEFVFKARIGIQL